MTNATTHDDLAKLGTQLRVDAIRASDAASSGHPTSSMSAADLIAVLGARHLKLDLDDPANPNNDHLIFSKGHATPLLWAFYKAAGAVSDYELLAYRSAGSPLEGHPTPRAPWIDVATGSLGQGLPIGVGFALAGKRLDQLPYHVWVLCGDSELAEGSMWEAFEHAGHEHLDNLTAIIDVNRLGQRGPTRHGWDLEAYQRRISAFDWRVIPLDGHDITEIDEAYAEAVRANRPTAILAKTVKGSGLAQVADREGRHGKPIKNATAAVEELGGEQSRRITVGVRDTLKPPHSFPTGHYNRPEYTVGDDVATRDAFGDALAGLASYRSDIVGLDGEVADSTRMETFAKAHAERFFQCYIAEQQMIGAAVAMQARGWVPYAATFAAFLTRAHDFIRMASIGRADLRLVGSHAGVAIGKDGPSQMGLEDIATMRAVHGSTVLCPCDANQAAALVAAMYDQDGISYLRTMRGETPVIYKADEQFPIGGSRTLRSSQADRVTLISAGATVHEALAAADELRRDGVFVRVIDLYSIKPIDHVTVREAASQTRKLITVEDHRPEGGLGEAVRAVFDDGGPAPPITNLAVKVMPASATPAEQLRHAQIDSTAIVETVRDLLSPAEEADWAREHANTTFADQLAGGPEAIRDPESPTGRGGHGGMDV